MMAGQRVYIGDALTLYVLLSSSKLPRQQLPHSSTWSMSQTPFNIAMIHASFNIAIIHATSRPSQSCHIISIIPRECTTNLSPQLVTEFSESERVCAHARLAICHMLSKATYTHRSTVKCRVGEGAVVCQVHS